MPLTGMSIDEKALTTNINEKCGGFDGWHALDRRDRKPAPDAQAQTEAIAQLRTSLHGRFWH